MQAKQVVWVKECIYRERYPASGSQVVQLTSAPCISYGIYCEQPYCSADGRRLAFMRGLYGHAQPDQYELWVCDLETMQLTMIDSGTGVRGAACAAYSGEFYYVLGHGDTKELVHLSLDCLEKQRVFDLSDLPDLRTVGTVSPDLRYYVNLIVPAPGRCQLARLDLCEKTWQVIYEQRDMVNPHPRFERGRGEVLMVQHNRGGEMDESGNITRLVGEEGATLFVIDREGGSFRPLPVGKPHTTPVTGHECWIGHTGEVILTVGSSAEDALRQGNLIAATPGAEAARVVARGFVWCHISASRDGRFFVGDATNVPTKPIVVGSIRTGRHLVLCESGTSFGAPQYTHPHPYLTSDNRWVIFNSDRTGVPQLYAASVPDGLLEGLE